MSAAKVLTDHDEIWAWAEKRGAIPSDVASTATDDDVGIIRLDFPGYSGEGTLSPIEWDEWFEKFDANGLALLVQEKTADGQISNFNKLVKRETVEPSKKKGAAKSKGTSAHR
ncbi:hypothetical protein [Sandaracinus amylolyticus]|uniref:hypothetical protein n=1 Tax=Sandaracinus amylolyticus TaxID=927083 RepID=UPI001F25C8E0|nr:hypothetical protein [Sandaracinus amylolyticus]UJR84417.1 Hypothetical protein I5071_64960 [Sandaracinus amylolyticus]